MVASPPTGQTRGLLEVAGVGLVQFPVTSAAVALILDLDGEPERLPETLATRQLCGCDIPVLPFNARNANAAIRAEHALALHGLEAPA